MKLQEVKGVWLRSQHIHGTVLRFCRRHLLHFLLFAAVFAPALLMLVALQENGAAAAQFQDVNQSGSLRFRSLWVYCAGRQGRDARPEVAAMSRIREGLRRRYPHAVAATDAPWIAFAGEEARVGKVSWLTADAMRIAANRLTLSIEAQAHREDDNSSALIVIGLLGMTGSFLATLFLLYSLRGAEERRARITAVLDSTTDLVGVSDSQGHILYLNNAFRNFLSLGLSEDISHVTIPSHIAPASYELLKTQGFPLSERDGSWQGETVFLAADGREVSMSQLVLAHKAVDGSVKQFSTVARDVTTQKQTEKALRAEQTRFAAIAAAQSDILASPLAADAVMELIAQKAMELTGAAGAVIALIEVNDSDEPKSAGQELVCRAACGSNINSLGLRLAMDGSLSGLCVQTGEMQICDEAETDSRTDAAACRSKGVVSMLMFPLHHEGSIIGVLNVLSPRRAAFAERDGQTLHLIAGFVGVALGRSREFEARRLLLEERTASLTNLQESQSLFLASIDAMQEGFAVQDWDGVVLMCNASAERILGMASSRFVGHLATSHGWTFFREDGTDFPREEHPTRVALRTGEAQPEVVFGVQRPGLPRQWLLLRAAPLFHVGESRPYAAVQTFSDITARKQAEDSLRLAETRLRTLVENAPLVFTTLDADGTFTGSEGRGLALMGLEPGELIGQSIEEVVADDEATLGRIHRAYRGEHVTYESEFGGLVWESQCVPLFNEQDDQKSVQGMIIVSHDITARQKAEDTLRRNEDRLRRLHNLTTARNLSGTQKMDALLVLGCEFFNLEIGVVTQIVGERYSITHAISPENSVPAGLVCATKDTYCSQVVQADQLVALANVGESSWRDLPAYAVFGLEAYLGAPLWVGDQIHGTLCFSSLSPHLQPFSDADLEILRLMAQWVGSELAREEAHQQIESYTIVLEFQKNELEKANAELEALATTDGLTAIKNRRAFQQRLSEEVIRAERYGSPLSLILLDVDAFKQYNDVFGHPEGDLVLQNIARLLQANARETDLAARYGGEEFVVLLPQTDTAGAWVIAERIREAVERFDWPHRSVTASLGIAALTPGMSGGSDLTAAADKALYASKAGGRNCITAAGFPAAPVSAA